MKTTWKIVFALFLLLPLAGCEEDDCGGGTNNPIADSPALIDPVRFWYKDAQGNPLLINRSEFRMTLMHEGEELPIGYRIVKDQNAEPVWGPGWGPGRPGEIISLTNYLGHLYQDGVITYIIHYPPSDVDHLRIEMESVNSGDCDEEQRFTFYYNDIKVLTADRIDHVFNITKP